jgi:hypothetical protein
VSAAAEPTSTTVEAAPAATMPTAATLCESRAGQEHERYRRHRN